MSVTDGADERRKAFVQYCKAMVKQNAEALASAIGMNAVDDVVMAIGRSIVLGMVDLYGEHWMEVGCDNGKDGSV